VPPRFIRKEAIEKLQKYGFPGNIRELRNLIERALILSSGTELTSADFPLGATANPLSGSPSSSTDWINTLPESISLRSLLEEIERNLVNRALRSSAGVQAEAARRLQLSRSDLSYKITKLGLKLPD